MFTLCLITDISCNFFFLCWKLGSVHRGYSFPHVLSSLIFVYIAMKMYAQIISDKIPPLSDCSQVFLVVITIMLQLNIHPNNYCNKVCGFRVTQVQIYLQVLIFPNGSLLQPDNDLWAACKWSFLYLGKTPDGFLMIPVLVCSGARLEPAMLFPASGKERLGAQCLLNSEEVLHRNVETCQINSQTL